MEGGAWAWVRRGRTGQERAVWWGLVRPDRDAWVGCRRGVDDRLLSGCAGWGGKLPLCVTERWPKRRRIAIDSVLFFWVAAQSHKTRRINQRTQTLVRSTMYPRASAATTGGDSYGGYADTQPLDTRHTTQTRLLTKSSGPRCSRRQPARARRWKGPRAQRNVTRGRSVQAKKNGARRATPTQRGPTATAPTPRTSSPHAVAARRPAPLARRLAALGGSPHPPPLGSPHRHRGAAPPPPRGGGGTCAGERAPWPASHHQRPHSHPPPPAVHPRRPASPATSPRRTRAGCGHTQKKTVRPPPTLYPLPPHHHTLHPLLKRAKRSPGVHGARSTLTQAATAAATAAMAVAGGAAMGRPPCRRRR